MKNRSSHCPLFIGFTLLLSMLLVGCGTQTIAATPLLTISPTATFDPKVTLRENLLQVLGADSKNIPRLTKISYSDPEAGDITITWAIKNTTKVDAQMDATNILKVLERSQTRFIYVILIGTFSTQKAEIQALRLEFNQSKLDKIQWENFQPSVIYNLADIIDVASEWK